MVMAGCAAPAARVRVGDSLEQAQHHLGAPTGRHARPNGGMRLEYAQGPFGRQTWMVDIDREGRVAAVEQVLTEARFQDVRPGMREETLLATLGRPSHRMGIWRGATVWSWRYETPFCQWFQVTVEPDGAVRDAGFGPDPLCEVDDNDRLPF